MFSASIPISTVLKIKLPAGERITSDDTNTVSVQLLGPETVIKAVSVGGCTIALLRNGVNVDSAHVDVTA